VHARPAGKIRTPHPADTIFMGMKIAKLLLVAVILLALAGAAFFLFGNYSDGYRAGTVIKLSRKGLIFKVYEGQLNLGMGIQDQHSQVAVSNVWDFSVSPSDTAALHALDTALMTGKRAKVHYREKFVKLPWRGDTKYQVYKVEME
jgi:hypothetical protein